MVRDGGEEVEVLVGMNQKVGAHTCTKALRCVSGSRIRVCDGTHCGIVDGAVVSYASSSPRNQTKGTVKIMGRGDRFS